MYQLENIQEFHRMEILEIYSFKKGNLIVQERLLEINIILKIRGIVFIEHLAVLAERIFSAQNRR